MLWRTMLRGTATALLAAASRSANATVQSSKDTPVPSGTLPWLLVYVDDESQGIGGGPPAFKTTGLVTVEIRAEKPSRPVNGVDLGRADVEAQLDTLTELVRKTLLSAQGVSVSIAVENGSAVATPVSMDNVFIGALVQGPGIDGSTEMIAIEAVNGNGTVTLSDTYEGSTGTYNFVVGSFVHLFEEITAIRGYPQYLGVDQRNHTASDTIEIKGHVTETYEAEFTQDLNGATIYVDSVNIFDPNGDYTGHTPFNEAQAAPRTSGPDGRPEGVVDIDTSS